MRTWTLGPTFATLLLGVGGAASQALAEDDCVGCGGGGPDPGEDRIADSSAASLLSSRSRSGVYEQDAAVLAANDSRRLPAAAAAQRGRQSQYDVAGLAEGDDLAPEQSANSVSQRRGAHLARALRVAATAYATPLTATSDTCMGSRSFGIQAAGFGFSFATTWQDHSCRRLKNARELFSLGYREAAVQLLCMDDEVYEAMERAGTPCPTIHIASMTQPFEPEPEPEVLAPPLATYSVLFDFDSSRLKPEADEALAPLLASLQADPSLAIDIEGHTDSVGSNAYNMALSQRRAQAVVEWLVAHGVARERIRAVGRGEAQPVAQNDSLPGRQQNRRVEIRRRLD